MLVLLLFEQKHLFCIHGHKSSYYLHCVSVDGVYIILYCIYSFFVNSVALCKPWELDDVNGTSKPGFSFIRFSFNCIVFVTVV